MENGVIQDARIAIGAAAAKPLRLYRVEEEIIGQQISEETATRAGELAIRGVTPLRLNGYKVPLMRNLVKRALRAEATS